MPNWVLREGRYQDRPLAYAWGARLVELLRTSPAALPADQAASKVLGVWKALQNVFWAMNTDPLKTAAYRSVWIAQIGPDPAQPIFDVAFGNVGTLAAAAVDRAERAGIRDHGVLGIGAPTGEMIMPRAWLNARAELTQNLSQGFAKGVVGDPSASCTVGWGCVGYKSFPEMGGLNDAPRSELYLPLSSAWEVARLIQARLGAADFSALVAPGTRPIEEGIPGYAVADPPGYHSPEPVIPVRQHDAPPRTANLFQRKAGNRSSGAGAPTPLASITLDPSSAIIVLMGGTPRRMGRKQLTVFATPVGGVSGPLPAGLTPTFESSNRAVATVNETGLVVAVGVGNAIIKATVPNVAGATPSFLTAQTAVKINAATATSADPEEEEDLPEDSSDDCDPPTTLNTQAQIDAWNHVHVPHGCAAIPSMQSCQVLVPTTTQAQVDTWNAAHPDCTALTIGGRSSAPVAAQGQGGAGGITGWITETFAPDTTGRTLLYVGAAAVAVLAAVKIFGIGDGTSATPVLEVAEPVVTRASTAVSSESVAAAPSTSSARSSKPRVRKSARKSARASTRKSTRKSARTSTRKSSRKSVRRSK